MKNANWTRILTILLSLLALYAILAVLAGIVQRFIVPILLVVMASILAFILTPVVGLIEKRLHIFRWLSILITYLIVACILGTLGFFMTSPLIAQTKSLADAIKNPTHLETLLRVKKTTHQLQVQSVSLNSYYNTLWAGDGPCAPLYFLKPAGGFPLSTPGLTGSGLQKGCSGSAGWWRTQVGNNLRAKLGPTIPSLLTHLEPQVASLHKSSVRPTSAEAAKNHSSFNPIATTQVPPSYVKPLKTDLTRLSTDVKTAQRDVLNGNYTTMSTLLNRVLRDTGDLDNAARTLSKRVATTPIIILALQNSIDSHHLPINLRNLFGSAIGRLRSQGTTVLDNAVTILTSTINVIFDLLIIIIMSLYLLADGERFIGWIMRLLPDQHREQAWFFVQSLNKVLGGYVRGQLIVAITVGMLAGVGCYVIGVPYALLLGIFAFLAESIPVVGPVLASVPAILVSLFTLSPLQTVFVAGWFLLIQQIEQNVVGPRITGRAVGIHPVAAMIAVIIGLDIGGFWGAFLAVPVTGMLFVIIAQAYNYLIRREPLPTAEVPESMELEEVERGATPAAE